MTTYRKSMSEALNQVYLGEDNMALLKKAAGGSAQKLKMKDGKVTMDSFTASAIMQVYKAINPKNKKTMENVVNTGTISALQKLQALAMRSIKSGYEVEHDGEELDEAKYTRKLMKNKSIVDYVKKQQEKNRKKVAKFGNKKVGAFGNEPRFDSGTGFMDMAADEIKLSSMSLDKRKAFDPESEYEAIARKLGLDKFEPRFEEVDLDEDGHTDVASAVRKCMTITEDAQEINSKLQTMSPEDSLPSWWTNKLAVASNDMNKMRDYIVNPVQEEVELDEFTKKDYDENEDNNMHTENAVELARKFGSKKEFDQMVAIYKAHRKKGEISRSDQMKRDALVKKYLPKLKEEVELDEAQEQIKQLEKMLKDLERKKNKTPGDGYAKMKIKELLADLKSKKEEVELDESKKALKAKSEKSGVSVGILSKVYDRGMAAYKTGHRPGTTPQQWALARVNSFLTGGGARKADADLWKQAKGQKEEVELDEASARADAMRAMRRGKSVDPADVDTDATDDDVKSASKNIMMQLRKSVSLRGNFPVEFMDKKKVKIPQKIAQAVLNKHNSFRKPMDKEKFQTKVSKSHKDLLNALKEGLKKKEETILDRIDSKLKERKNG